jgi:2-amino-4-hydroxy-6-hydroxymethyldihydropteridine diphosphokinase
MPRVFVAAGSNVEPERHLARAAELLGDEFGEVRCSPWYRNRAVGFEGADFINFVVGFDTELPVTDVVTRLRAIETACGRPRDAPKWAPRTIDLDILLYGELVSAASPTLPRPDLLRRAYMLGPLADLAPEVMHPTAGLTIAQLWSQFDRAAHPLERVPAALTSPRSARHRSPGSGR